MAAAHQHLRGMPLRPPPLRAHPPRRPSPKRHWVLTPSEDHRYHRRWAHEGDPTQITVFQVATPEPTPKPDQAHAKQPRGPPPYHQHKFTPEAQDPWMGDLGPNKLHTKEAYKLTPPPPPPLCACFELTCREVSRQKLIFLIVPPPAAN